MSSWIVTQLIPPWAPNVHPMIVHFPIVLVLLAAASDVFSLAFRRLKASSWIPTLLYGLGAVSAVSAYVTGRLAGETVFVPGMAHSMVESHEEWALATTVTLVGAAIIRVGSHLAHVSNRRIARALFLALGLIAVVLVQQTAERGARLVYEQGVGVVPGPVPGGLPGNQ
jgi:uncharacterized membrane protein